MGGDGILNEIINGFVIYEKWFDFGFILFGIVNDLVCLVGILLKFEKVI